LGHRSRAHPQTRRPHHPDHGRDAVPHAVRAGRVPDRPARPARGHPRQRRPPPGRAAPDHDQGTAGIRIRSGAAAMTVRAWLKLTISLWLLRKAARITGWLLLAALAVAAWPVTLAAVAGYAAAWLRGWPAVRLGRAAASMLPFTAIWLAAGIFRDHG